MVNLQRGQSVCRLHHRTSDGCAFAPCPLAAARRTDAEANARLHQLEAWPRAEHRRRDEGIDYVDDSKGTNVGATVAALDGLAQRAVLIAGGDGKGQDFEPLAAPVARWCRAVMPIGRDAPQIRAALADSGVTLDDQPTLEAATRAATALAEPGDVVLLSPACASFDMFKGYAHRAAVFRDTSRKSPQNGGR